MRILSKVLVVCAVLVAGCAPDRDAAMNRFISRGALAQQGAENGDEISYWDGTRSEGEPRIVIDLDQQRAYFYRGDQIIGVSAVSTGQKVTIRLPVSSELRRKTGSMSRVFTETTSTKADRS